MFQLQIKIGNEAMQTASDVADALRMVAERLDERGFDEPGIVRDINGNLVGAWEKTS
jgi:sulfur carrier protein ThiS